MSDAINIEIGATIDPKLQRAFKVLEQRVVALDKGLVNVKNNLSLIERAARTQGALIANSYNAVGRSIANVVTQTRNLTAARAKDVSASQRNIRLLNEEAKARKKASEASRGRVGEFLSRRADSTGLPVKSAAITGGVGASILESSGFNYRNQLIANTGDLTDKERDSMGNTIRDLSKPNRTNQTTKELQAALEVYTSAGLPVMTKGLKALEATGKVATAYGIEIADVATTNAAAMANMGISADEIGKFLNVMSAAGKAGQFEMKDFAAYFGSMSAGMEQLGIKGLEGSKYMAAALQAIRIASPDSAGAATNFENLKDKIFAQETFTNFEEQFGFDLPAFIREVQKGAKGRQAKYGGNVMAAFVDKTKELTKGGDLIEVNKVARDAQFRKALVAMIQNTEIFGKAMDAANSSQDVFAKDFARTMTQQQEQIKTFKIEMLDLASRVGDTLAPSLSDLGKEITKVVTPLAEWISQNPKLTVDILKATGAIMALNLAIGPAVKLFNAGVVGVGAFTSAIRWLGVIAPAAGLSTGSGLGEGINRGTQSKLSTFFGAGGGFAKFLGGAAVVATAAATGYIIGSAIGEAISDSILAKTNAALDGGAALLAGSSFKKLADKLAGIRSANDADKKAALDFLKNPYARESINKELKNIEDTRPRFQKDKATLESALQRPMSSVGGMYDQGAYQRQELMRTELDKVSGALNTMQGQERGLREKLGLIDYAERLKAGDASAIQQAADANKTMKDEEMRAQAGMPSAIKPQDRIIIQSIRDVSVSVTGIESSDPAAIAAAVRSEIEKAKTEQDSDMLHKTRAAQDNQTIPH